jgi:hypothetical protein
MFVSAPWCAATIYRYTIHTTTGRRVTASSRAAAAKLRFETSNGHRNRFGRDQRRLCKDLMAAGDSCHETTDPKGIWTDDSPDVITGLPQVTSSRGMSG